MPVVINFKICDNSEFCDAIHVCPVGAFRWNDEKKSLEIDNDKCISCGKCATSEESCGVGAIRFAENEEELEKIKKEIEEDSRTFKDLMVDRYGAQPINIHFCCKENDFEKVISTKKTILVEIVKEDIEECLIKSIPIKEIFDVLDIPDLIYRKIEIETEELIEKYNIEEVPALLMFKDGKLIAKMEGYYSVEEKDSFVEKIKGCMK